MQSTPKLQKVAFIFEHQTRTVRIHNKDDRRRTIIEVVRDALARHPETLVSEWDQRQSCFDAEARRGLLPMRVTIQLSAQDERCLAFAAGEDLDLHWGTYDLEIRTIASNMVIQATQFRESFLNLLAQEGAGIVLSPDEEERRQLRKRAFEERGLSPEAKFALPWEPDDTQATPAMTALVKDLLSGRHLEEWVAAVDYLLLWRFTRAQILELDQAGMTERLMRDLRGNGATKIHAVHVIERYWETLRDNDELRRTIRVLLTRPGKNEQWVHRILQSLES